MGSWDLAPGLNAVGAYQASGAPYATGSLDGTHGHRPGGHEIVFPYVTRWFQVTAGSSGGNCKVSFSVSGMTGSYNYFTVKDGTNSGPLEMKVSSIWVSGSNNVDIVAGLTGIPAFRTRTDSGPNWSGSAGVG
jgi:hypothetical protein